MEISNINQQLHRDEGCKLTVYNDSRGIPTIGVGRNLTSTGISLYEADVLLNDDIARVTKSLQSNLNWFSVLDPVRQGALINMAFNLGIDSLLTFKMFLHYMESGNYNAASTDVLNTTWATEVGDRAQRLANQIKLGIWQ